MTDESEPIELVGAGDAEVTSPASHAGEQSQVHAWGRTAAAVVAALSVLWTASAVADMRDVDEQQICSEQLHSSVPAYAPGPLRPEWVDRLVQTAEDCDLPLLADAFRQRYGGE